MFLFSDYLYNYNFKTAIDLTEVKVVRNNGREYSSSRAAICTESIGAPDYGTERPN